MRLKQLEEKLLNNQNKLPENKRRTSSLRSECDVSNIDVHSNLKIVGVTGSKGKTSVCVLVHNYLKYIGEETITYNSAFIDSKTSINTSCEVALQNEGIIIDIIEEAKAQQTKYLILEVNESSIVKGIVKDIPFNIRVLTNINKDNSIGIYDNDEYINIKKSFFQNVTDECVNIFGLTNCFSKEEYESLLTLNNYPSISFGSRYICNIRGVDISNIKYLVQPSSVNLDSINGIEFELKVKDEVYNIKSNLLFFESALNIACAVAILDTLNVLDMSKFIKYISNTTIPGRNEVIRVNNKTIIIGISLIPVLEELYKYKQDNQITNIITVVGSAGDDFSTWSKEFKSNKRKQELDNNRLFGMNYVAKYSSKVYLTSNDNGATNPNIIVNKLNSYINNRIPTILEENRKTAIKKAIEEASTNDVIFIAGRGNRRIFCKNENEIELYTDKEIVLSLK